MSDFSTLALQGSWHTWIKYEGSTQFFLDETGHVCTDIDSHYSSTVLVQPNWTKSLPRRTLYPEVSNNHSQFYCSRSLPRTSWHHPLLLRKSIPHDNSFELTQKIANSIWSISTSSESKDWSEQKRDLFNIYTGLLMAFKSDRTDALILLWPRDHANISHMQELILFFLSFHDTPNLFSSRQVYLSKSNDTSDYSHQKLRRISPEALKDVKRRCVNFRISANAFRSVSRNYNWKQ